ncbi:WD40-repeat-containing domain protein [Dimargaris cristalligena]|uniref:WD40-repeat-containing domain protein n=1 Tax=Dimargaris cristalligena TaxID=215637 RepID=A0A4P9ZWT8_9FUNG|nr:WD40-repeat-containing domain protein [Dimargaris cristalligena]|eukprot:RKP37808.1 WD40-repeat-containing domain protein [Dimargaris cristalligena]
MDFSVLYKHIGGQVVFSPDGKYLASSLKERLVIRDSLELGVLHTFICSYPIQDIQWGPHSDYILSASYKQAKVDVWNLQDEKRHIDIEDAFCGMNSARWCPDGIHIMVVSEFQVRLSIWSLLSGEAFYIQYPKYKDKGISYSSDDRFVAILERQESKDAVGVYSTDPWALQKQFTVDAIDIENIAWSPDDRYIAVWDSNVDYKVFIYNPLGILKRTYRAYEDGLGIKSVTWDPFSQFLAVGSYDQQVRLLNTYNWSPFLTLKHPSKVTRPDVVSLNSYFELQDKYSNITTVVPDGTKPNPKLGIGFMEFSYSGDYFCTRNDNMPNSLWIWDMKTLRLYAFIHMIDPIRTVRWNPASADILAFSCTANCVYLWRPERGCEFYELPAANFNLTTFHWSPSGHAIAFLDKERFHLGFVARPSE